MPIPSHSVVTMANDDEINERKRFFARALILTPNEPWAAAQRTFPDDTGAAFKAARDWVLDETVIEAMGALRGAYRDTGDQLGLPTKEDLIRSMWKRLHDPDLYADDFAKIAKVYADVRGYIAKETKIETSTTNNVSNVMLVPHALTDDDWQKGLAENQHELTNKPILTNGRSVN